MRNQNGGFDGWLGLGIGLVIVGIISIIVAILLATKVIKSWLFNNFNKKLKINIRLIYKLKFFLKWRKVEL